MPWMIIITMSFSINCLTVIVYPSMLFMIEMPLVNAMDTGFIHFVLKQMLQFLVIFSYFYLLYLPLLELILATSKNKGSDTPCLCLVQPFVCVCAGTVKVACVPSPIGLINLGS